MQEFVTHSYEETLQMAADFAKTVKKGTVIGFIGGLGMGKTAFTSGFVKGLGINADVSSPTFAICNEYIGIVSKVGTICIPPAFLIISIRAHTFLPSGAKMFSAHCRTILLLLRLKSSATMTDGLK